MEQNVENVVEETTQDQVVETKADESKFDSAGDDTILKVDLSQPPPEPTQDEIKENNPNNEGVVTELDNAESTEKQEEIQPQEQTQEAPVLEEVTNEEVKEQAEELTEEIIEAQETGKALPENLQKVVDFMEDTGGSLAMTMTRC
jgi:Rps23 Pro-64 3,4-dihydroxylase Tpa1-like proline 4-hydroxylase